MTMKEAQELGYVFTGTTWDTWRDKPEYIEKRKAEAREIKKMINGADYRIARGKKSDWLGSSTSYAIMGNNTFIVYGDKSYRERTEKRIAGYENARIAIEERCKKELEELEASYLKDVQFIKEYEKLLKK